MSRSLQGRSARAVPPRTTGRTMVNADSRISIGHLVGGTKNVPWTHRPCTARLCGASSLPAPRNRRRSEFGPLEGLTALGPRLMDGHGLSKAQKFVRLFEWLQQPNRMRAHAVQSNL